MSPARCTLQPASWKPQTLGRYTAVIQICLRIKNLLTNDHALTTATHLQCITFAQNHILLKHLCLSAENEYEL
jgi:hypothetical protein